MLEAVIFDFDGTIVDTETVWYDVYKEVLHHQYGIELPLEVFAKVIGTTDEVLFKFIEDQASTEINKQEIESMVHERFQEKKSDLEVRVGVRDRLQEAKELGLKLGVASSSSRAWVEGYLRQFGLWNYFSVIKTKEDVARVKPDPALYLKALQDMQVEPSRSLAIEDSVNGSIAAIEAGMKCLVVPNQVTSFLSFHEKTVRFESFSDFDFNRLSENK
ncbi:HAD family hydrolase [Neobacillus sp. Marseille-QA0830]